MENFVFLAVLFAALCHAGWNALIKVRLDPLVTTALISVGAGTVAAFLLPFFPMPGWVALPWLIASALIHFVYYSALIEAYRAGDLGQVYPIARGAAPLMTAAAATFIIGETLSLTGWAGIALLVAGVFWLSARGGRQLAKIDRRAVGFALLTALSICAYSVVDGIGARVSANAVSYSLVHFLTNTVVLVPYAVYRKHHNLTAAVREFWWRGLAGGALQVVAYSTVLWAMTLAPIAIVAALRESSVLFGAVIAVVLLKEPLRLARMVSAALIVGGLVLIRLV